MKYRWQEALQVGNRLSSKRVSGYKFPLENSEGNNELLRRASGEVFHGASFTHQAIDGEMAKKSSVKADAGEIARGKI
ncbi:hypothetical protein TNCV_4133071 [Trichonephila clavipes]|nr:hypothetical protein TNCV_4133071 [Trichonephila clavipes]